ncbi:hypothetical protein AHiyo8_00670 [Arthrobacter sp. Hiyo8]|nr:hypothetical protein AHiyo8_00670 [Arthrobacter sp. Hiyo8]
MTEKRIAVLLGAGASVDAGLPMSTDLTKLLVEKLGEQLTYDRSVLDALHFVCSAMIGHRGSAGSPHMPASMWRRCSQQFGSLANGLNTKQHRSFQVGFLA